MKAKVSEARAELVQREAQVPAALAAAFRDGHLRAKPKRGARAIRRGEPKSDATQQRPNSPRGGDDKEPNPNPFPRAREENE